MSEKEIRFIDLFGGIGGFRLGLQQASSRFKCVWYCDIKEYAVQVYNKQFKEQWKPTDVTTVDIRQIPKFDILCSGFPCQPFSVSGKREGFQDTRGTLFFEICKIIQEKRPRLLFLENVKGLLSTQKGECFKSILLHLDELGYDVEWQILNSKYFSSAQTRERLYIVGHNRKKSTGQIFPIKGSINKIPELLYQIEGDTPSGISRQGDRMYGVNGTCPTLTASFRPPLIYDGNELRYLTPIEYERLQGFPDDWTKGITKSKRYDVLGNSVTVNVIETIGRELIKNIN